MRSKTIIIIILVLAMAVISKFLFFPSAASKTAPPQKGPPAAANITAMIVNPEKLDNSIYASGTLIANEEALLQPEISGKVTRINFVEGSRVFKGQLLVKINDADFQAQYQKLKMQFALAETQLNRQKQLLAINGISKDEFDVTQNQYNTIKADIDYALAQIAKTEIKAPFDGTIGLKNVSEGAYVTPAVVLAGIQQINPVKIDFTVGERYATLLKKGDKVIFNIEGNKDDLTGEIFAIDPKIDMATRSLRVRAICPNPKGNLFPGAFAKIKIALDVIEGALMVPTQCIIPELKGKRIYRITNGKADFVKVETGIRTNEMIQVTSGLNPGDTIITTGIMALKPGMAVNIKELK